MKWELCMQLVDLQKDKTLHIKIELSCCHLKSLCIIFSLYLQNTSKSTMMTMIKQIVSV